MVSEGGCFHQNNQKCGRPFKLEATSSETGNKEKFLLKQSCGSLERDPGGYKKIKNREQFLKMHTEDTERIWWRTPRTAKRRIPANGGTTSGSRHIQRDPKWVIGCKQTRNKKQEKPGANYKKKIVLKSLPL